MSFFEIILLGLSVSVDAFAVSIGGSLCDRTGKRWKNAFLAALFFGLFQWFMPLIGAGAASLLDELVRACDHWIAFALLTLVGGNMIHEALSAKEEKSDCPLNGQFFTPLKLLLPAVATSLDALAVGAGLRFSSIPVMIPAFAMGVITGMVSASGVLLGSRIGELNGEKPMSIAGGCAIILIGVKILLQDLGLFRF